MNDNQIYGNFIPAYNPKSPETFGQVQSPQINYPLKIPLPYNDESISEIL